MNTNLHELIKIIREISCKFVAKFNEFNSLSEFLCKATNISTASGSEARFIIKNSDQAAYLLPLAVLIKKGERRIFLLFREL
jgi:hypothetical protein